MSLVSIIIPAYNSAAFLPAAIESCIGQTYSRHEIIVVDDGSTDNTESVVANYPQVRYIYQENRGTSAAKNTGLWHVQGEFIQFLDADDLLLPRKIERCLEVFRQYPEAGLVYTDYQKRSHDLRQILTVPRPPDKPEGQVFHQLIQQTSSYFGIHCALTRREVMEAVGGFNEELTAAEDWLLWVQIAALGVEFRYLDEALVWYRDTPGSASKSDLKMALNRLRAIEILSEMPLPEGVDIDQLLAGRHHVVAMRYWQVGQRREARQHFETALDLRPSEVDDVMLMFSYFMSASIAEAILNLFNRIRISVKKLTARFGV